MQHWRPDIGDLIDFETNPITPTLATLYLSMLVQCDCLRRCPVGVTLNRFSLQRSRKIHGKHYYRPFSDLSALTLISFSCLLDSSYAQCFHMPNSVMTYDDRIDTENVTAFLKLFMCLILPIHSSNLPKRLHVRIIPML